MTKSDLIMEQATHQPDKVEAESGSSKTFIPPKYTMKDIHDAIPRHCLEPQTLLSLGYVVRDFFFAGSLVYTAATLIPSIQSIYLRVLAWVTYSFCQGLVFTGLWELAHECGHGALSKHKWVNNTMGMVIHSVLLVPYHSWRHTHASHHKSTNNLDRDIAFVPAYKEDYLAARESRKQIFRFSDLVEDAPIAALITLFFHQLIAFPIYLTINNFALDRMRAYPWYKRSHYYFGSDGPNFKPAHRNDIILSDLGIALAFATLWACAKYFGGWNVVLFYVFPYAWTNHWILMITFLQHTDAALPYYPSKTWNFLRGAASTVDRDFGFIGTFVFHGAIETHVVHHHNSRIPFYHAAEASEAIQVVMGEHYQSDFKTPYMWAFWKNYTNCLFVEERDEGSDVFFFPKTS